jgi:hypothetical protein
MAIFGELMSVDVRAARGGVVGRAPVRGAPTDPRDDAPARVETPAPPVSRIRAG